MNIPQTIISQHTGKDLVDMLLAAMEANFHDFVQDQKKYLYTVKLLEKELGNTASPSIQDEIQAIEQQTVSNLLFSGFLGLKANLDNFIDPVGKSFLDVDFEVYLREETARRLPEYQQAQQIREQFYSLLSPAQKEEYENIITYVSHLETVGPKLAHYYGYLLGNEILYRVIPGYHPDTIQTLQYGNMLEEFLGIQL